MEVIMVKDFDVNVVVDGMNIDEIKIVLRLYNNVLDTLSYGTDEFEVVNLLVIRVREELMKIEE